MQALDVQIQNPVKNAQVKSADKSNKPDITVLNRKTGAEPAEKGDSFLAIIEKMLAGTRDGTNFSPGDSFVNTAGRGAGDDSVPGDENTLIKQGAGKGKILHASIKKGTPKQNASVVIDPPEIGKVQKSAKQKDGLTDTNPCLQVENTRTDPFDEILAGKDQTVSILPEKKRGETKTGDGKAVVDLTGQSALGISNPLQTKKVSENTALQDTANDTKTEKPGKRDKKLHISVIDQRSADPQVSANDSPLVKSTTINGDNSADMSLSLRNPDNGSSSLQDATAHVAESNHNASSQSFSSMLSQELSANASDFVKTGQIVLRDNNAGLIRLSLHPETLGNVKIRLELSDRKISGRIIVNSQEAYDAFNENLDGLSQAFVDGGFDSAGFDLSWSGQGTDGSGDSEADGANSSPFYASSIPDVISTMNSADTNTDSYRVTGSSAVNVFA